MQAAFGPIAAAYLAAQGWTAKDIGFVLGIGGFASLVSQAPGGELLDTVKAKRVLVATGIVAVALSILIFYFWPSFLPVALAEVLQGITGGVLGAGIVAITLGLVGHRGLADQIGQNQRFAAAGGIAVTLTMAVVAYSEAPWAMLVPTALAASALLALGRIRGDEIDFARASGADDPRVDRVQRARRRAALLQNRRLLIFAACAVMFQVANAPMLPLVSGMLAHVGKREAAPLVAALPIRAVLFALTDNPHALIAIQILDGITACVVGVMTPLVLADVTKGTGRFNLAQGVFGTIMGIGASVSPALTGLIVDRFGYSAGFVGLAIGGLLALLVLALFMPETKEDRPT
jgi:MFS family permease